MVPDDQPPSRRGFLLYKQVRSLSETEYGGFLAEMLSDHESSVGLFVTALVQLGMERTKKVKALRKIRNDLTEQIEKLRPLMRKGQAPKSPRNQIILQCLNEQQFKKEQIYKFMLEHHRGLMLIGKKNRPIGEKSMWDHFNRWLRKNKSE